MKWRVVAFPWNDTTQKRELRAAKNRELVLRLKSPTTLSFTMDGMHRQALFIEELVTDVMVSLDGTDLVRLRSGNGMDTVGETGYGIQFNFNDYREVLRRRFLKTADTLAYPLQEQYTICMGMITNIQSRTNGNYGIVAGVGNPTGFQRVRNLLAGNYVGKEIADMADNQNGFDWNIGPAMTFDVYSPQRGADNGVVVEYGKSISSFTRNRNPGSFANDTISTGGAGTTVVEQPSATVAADTTGRWDSTLSYPEVTEQATLNDKGLWAVGRSSVIQAPYNIELVPGFWEGPDHINVGDTVQVRVRKGRIDDDFSARVTSIPIKIKDDGGETVRLVF